MKNEVEKAIERWDGCSMGWAHINKVPGTRWLDRRRWRRQALVDLDTLVRFLQTDGGRKLVRESGAGIQPLMKSNETHVSEGRAMLQQ